MNLQRHAWLVVLVLVASLVPVYSGGNEYITITPSKKLQASKNLTMTRKDNLLWFAVKLEAGTAYFFQTTGKGDADMYILKKEQVLPDFTVSGDAQAQNSDDGPGYNARLLFTPKESGDYVVKLILFSGKRWSGTLQYQVK